tara:strand:- start:553 stop:1821 length:1269 start_codon:yes stop_codon:yes gene_type:complete
MPIFVGAGTSSFMKDTGGVGFSRRTATEIGNLSGMVAGQVVYDTTAGALKFYDGSSWIKVSSAQAVLNSVSGNILVGTATNLTLSGEAFLASGLVVNFTQSADSINVNVTVTPSSDTAATVAVPASVYNNVTAGRVVVIKVTNSDGTTSSSVNKTALALPSGGNISTSGGYRIHTFTSSGTFVNTIPSLSSEYLIVAGGGGGGAQTGGGGGAGGMRTGTSTLSTASYSITVGAGGNAAPAQSQPPRASSGTDSVFNSITSIGGGGGGSYQGGSINSQSTGANGGSGGGGAAMSSPGGSGTSGQGNNGGQGRTSGEYDGGGGGGASQAGFAGNSASHGGNGSASSITGSSITYAGGGGGCGQSGNPVGNGGAGGGGAGGNDVQPGVAGTVNRGGGGGGSRDYGGVGGGARNGGSGVVIVRYQL